MEEILTKEFSEEYKNQVLDIIKKSTIDGAILTNGEFIILMHWKRHENDPAYSFVPEEYRGYK